MAKKITVKGCPCCGAPGFWTIGNRETRMNDRTVCLECDLEMEGDYTPNHRWLNGTGVSPGIT